MFLLYQKIFKFANEVVAYTKNNRLLPLTRHFAISGIARVADCNDDIIIVDIVHVAHDDVTV